MREAIDAMPLSARSPLGSTMRPNRVKSSSARRRTQLKGAFRPDCQCAATQDVCRFRSEADMNRQARSATSVANEPSRHSSCLMRGAFFNGHMFRLGLPLSCRVGVPNLSG